jgi:hypothetical protein
MSVDSPEQLRALRRVGRLVGETIALLRDAVRPGLILTDGGLVVLTRG